MGLVRTDAELAQLRNHFANGDLLGDTTMVIALFGTDPKVLQRLLPPPLEAPLLLIRQPNAITRGTPETGTLTLAPSTLDSLSEIPILEVLMAGYTTGMQVWMKPGTILTPVNPKQYQRYSFINADWSL